MLVSVDGMQCGDAVGMQGDYRLFMVSMEGAEGAGDEGWTVWVDDVGMEVVC